MQIRYEYFNIWEFWKAYCVAERTSEFALPYCDSTPEEYKEYESQPKRIWSQLQKRVMELNQNEKVSDAAAISNAIYWKVYERFPDLNPIGESIRNTALSGSQRASLFQQKAHEAAKEMTADYSIKDLDQYLN